MTRRILAWLSVLLLAACAAPDVRDYQSEQPVLELRRYFDGKLTGYGIFTDRQGAVKARFVVDLFGRWQGNEGTLEEDFRYSDGRRERRVWHLRQLGPGRYVGRADDVVGPALGEAAGNSLRWNYTLRLPVDGKVHEVQFDDWMVLVDERVMLNKATMSKFGFRLGEVTLSFVK